MFVVWTGVGLQVGPLIGNGYCSYLQNASPVCVSVCFFCIVYVFIVLPLSSLWISGCFFCFCLYYCLLAFPFPFLFTRERLSVSGRVRWPGSRITFLLNPVIWGLGIVSTSFAASHRYWAAGWSHGMVWYGIYTGCLHIMGGFNTAPE